MQKTVLIAQVAEETGISKRLARQVIDKTLDIITQQLESGDKVVLTGFGTFQMRSRRERRGVNPQTGEEMRIPAMQTPGFTPSNTMRERVTPPSSSHHEHTVNE